MRKQVSIVTLAILCGSHQVMADTGDGPNISIDISSHHGKLTINTQDAPFSEVLSVIAQKVGFQLEIVGQTDSVATISMKDVSVDKALKQLLAFTSVMMRYGTNETGDRTLREVHVIIQGEADKDSSLEVDNLEMVDQAIGLPMGEDRSKRLESLKPLLKQPGGHLTDLHQSVAYDSDSVIRMLAVIAVGKQPIDKSAHTLSTALRDPSGLVRSRAVMALGRMPHTDQTVKLLSRVLLDESDSKIRRMAAKRLGRIGNMQAITALRTAVTDEDKDVRQVVEAALARLEAY